MGAISISFTNGNQSCSMGPGNIFDVSLTMEKGSIYTVDASSFSNIADNSNPNNPKLFSSIIEPGKTIASVSEGSTSIMLGRVFSIGNGVSQHGSVSVCIEDCRGFLRESFIWYSIEPDDAEPEPGEIPDEKFRAKKGDDIADLLDAISDNHNLFMTTCYSNQLQAISQIYGISGLPQGAVLKHDLSLDGVSSLEAINLIFEDLGFEWDLNSLNGGISIQCAKKITNSGGGDIVSGRSLKSASKTINVQESYSAILPLGGFGYCGRRLSLSNHDFNTTEAQAQLSSDPTAIDRFVQVYDPDTQQYIDDPEGEREGILAINSILVSKFGLRIMAVIYDETSADFEDADDIAEQREVLVKLAKKDAEKLNEGIVEWSVEAADLNGIGIGPSFNRLYGMYNISDSINHITVTNCRLIKINKNYDDPSSSTFEFEIPTALT